MKQKAKYRLVENGIDSIMHGIDHFLQGEKDTKNYKYAILHIFHGVEMVLKEKLFKINPILIYANIDKKIEDDSPTVGFSKLYARLENVGKKLSREENETIRKIQRVRNQIEHKEVSFSIEDVKSIIGRSIKLLINFMRNELTMNLQKHINENTYEILLDMIDFYEEKLKVADEKIQEYLGRLEPKERLGIDIFFCPECWKKTIIIKPDERGVVECYFCKEEFFVNYCRRCGIPILTQSKSDDAILCDVCQEFMREP